MTNEISLSLDLNVKDGNNFCVSVSKPWLFVDPCLLIAIQLCWNFKPYCFYFFPKSALLNWGCGLSTNAAYTRTFYGKQLDQESIINFPLTNRLLLLFHQGDRPLFHYQYNKPLKKLGEHLKGLSITRLAAHDLQASHVLPTSRLVYCTSKPREWSIG